MEHKYRPSDLANLSPQELIILVLRQQDLILRLEERIKQLETQTHKDSHNSSLPPSQFSPPHIKNLREKSNKPLGGQPGHPGHTLLMVSNPTRIIRYSVTRCEHCGRDLSGLAVSTYERRQVFDIPALICEVTEYQAEKKRCICGHLTKAVFPKEVLAPVQYGPNICTLVSLLANHGFLSCQRISELIQQLVGHRLNEATLCSLQNKLSARLASFENQSKLDLIQSEVIHNDETGIPIEGKLAWLHVTSSQKLTHYGVDLQRGKAAMDRIGILPNFQGFSMHDDLKAYFQYDQCRHGSCNVHHLRELTFFEEEEQAKWAGYLKELLCSAKTQVKQAREGGQNHLDQLALQAIENQYDEIVGGALLMQSSHKGKRGKWKKTEQQTFLDRLLKYKRHILAFLYDFGIPFDNNLAERDLRMLKVKEKVSGTFRSFKGAQSFALIRGYLSTVRKNEGNIFVEVRNAFAGHSFHIPHPQAVSC